MTSPPIAVRPRRRGLPGWAQPVLLAVVLAAVIGFVLLPRFTPDDPLSVIGAEGSPARQIANALSGTMTCTAGEITADRGVLACYAQDSERVSLAFVQADRAGQVASYTVEALPLGSSPDTGQTVALANQVAGIVTPGRSFTGCGHDSSASFFCFGSLASWRSSKLKPAQSTGAKKRLPAPEKLDTVFAASGWSCTYGICAKGAETLTVQQTLTGLGLRFGSSTTLPDVRASTAAMLAETKQTGRIRQWVAQIDGKVRVIVADRLVVGYLPQLGGGGLLVVDEVAGVLADEA